jgi:hypothetical protein
MLAAVKSILERIEQLMALAASPNEHEARNAALLAVQLMRKHKVVLAMPAGVRVPSPSRGTARTTPSRGTAPASQRTPPVSERTPGTRRRSTPRGVKRVVDPPEKIVAPLGGECIHCGHRYRAETTICWFASGGGMHMKCFEEWARAGKS